VTLRTVVMLLLIACSVLRATEEYPCAAAWNMAQIPPTFSPEVVKQLETVLRNLKTVNEVRASVWDAFADDKDNFRKALEALTELDAKVKADLLDLRFDRLARECREKGERGDANEQFYLGSLYSSGNGLARNEFEAAKWYRRAALLGNGAAQVRLGEYSELQRNYPEAAKWYLAALEQKHSVLLHLFTFLSEPIPRELDERLAEAVEVMAKTGNPQAQTFIALMSQKGRGVPQDERQAARWLLRGAHQNENMAQLFLGRAFRDGNGVPQNYIQAYMWFNILAAGALSDLGVKEARLERDELVHLMSTLQVAEAQNLANAWKPQWEQPVPDPKQRIRGGTPELSSTATGFFVSVQGHIITNSHAVAGCTTLFVKNVSGRRKVSVLNADVKNDLALLTPFGVPVAVLPFSESPRLALGQRVVAVGYPLQGLLASSLSLTTGTISALAGLRDDSRQAQITAPVQPGNSGGPLLDESGNVVGVVSSKLDALAIAELVGDLPQNVNFAIKGAIARSFLESNAISYLTAPSSGPKANTAIAEKARKSVVIVECWK
jgi:TPR repeat protein